MQDLINHDTRKLEQSADDAATIEFVCGSCKGSDEAYIDREDVEGDGQLTTMPDLNDTRWRRKYKCQCCRPGGYR